MLKFLSPFVNSVFPLSLSPFFPIFFDIFILLHVFFLFLPPPLSVPAPRALF